MKRREMKLLLEERFERIALLETRIDTMDQLVEGYRAREQSVLDALQAAKVNAAKALEQAQAEGAQIRAEAQKTLAEAEQARINARAEAEALLSDAISAANTLKAEAERRAADDTASVRAESERMLRDAEIIKREYEEMVDSFNAMLEQNASELEITAARFAEFVKNRKIDRAEARLDGNAFYKSVGEMSDAALPDASEDPALLMQNIYRIQNRPLPEDRQDAKGAQDEQQAKDETEPTAVEPASSEEPPQTEAAVAPEFPMQDGNGADERQSIVEPYSEAAWRSETHESESEPQAEFTKSFDNAYVKSDYTIHDDECSVTQADVESEFDAMMSSGTSLARAATVAIPATAALVSEKLAPEPMADAARAFDAYFDETFEPAGKTAQDEIPTEQATEPQGTAPQPESAPEYVSDSEAEEILKSFPDAGATDAAQVAATPEPYSARAWEHESFTSELEPQAEGTLFGEQELEQRVPTQAVSEPFATNDAEQAFDDYLAGIGVMTPPVSAQTAKPAEPERSAPEPYSARAWEHESFTNELEPQAEGTLFGEQEVEPPTPTQVYSEYEKQPSTSNDAERAFDDYLAGIGVYTPAVPAQTAKPAEPETTSAPEPYSARAWERESFTSELEPQAEGALFGERETEPVQPSSGSDAYDHQPASSNDAERAFDDYLTNISSIMAPSQPATPTVDTSWSYEEPYREEPSQAQPAAYEAPAEEEEEEPKPAPRRYNEYGEIREWEPEPEPDMGDIPTVSRFVGQSSGEEEISLDDLLDEIIKAGD